MCDLSFRYRISRYPKIYRGIVYDTFCRLMGRGITRHFGKIAQLQWRRCVLLQRGSVRQDILGGRKCVTQKSGNGGIKVQISYRMSRSLVSIHRISQSRLIWDIRAVLLSVGPKDAVRKRSTSAVQCTELRATESLQ